MRRHRIPPAYQERSFTEDRVNSLAEICGERYRALKERDTISFSSTDEDQIPLQLKSPSNPNIGLWMPVAQTIEVKKEENRHKRSSSEFPRSAFRPKPTSEGKSDINELEDRNTQSSHPFNSDDEDMSENERIIRSIIKIRDQATPLPWTNASEDSLNSPLKAGIGFTQEIGNIVEEIAGARKTEETRRWKLKQHLLKLLVKKEKATYDEVFYDSDVKRSREVTQPALETRASQVSNGTVQGPGSSFLVKETYERDKPIPEFHKCAKLGMYPGRNQFLSTHSPERLRTKEELVSNVLKSKNSEVIPKTKTSRNSSRRDPNSRLRVKAATERLLVGRKKHKDAVFRILDSVHSAAFLLVLREGGKSLEFLGLYSRNSGAMSLQRKYAVVDLPESVSTEKVETCFRFDVKTGSFQSIEEGRFDLGIDAVTLKLGDRL